MSRNFSKMLYQKEILSPSLIPKIVPTKVLKLNTIDDDVCTKSVISNNDSVKSLNYGVEDKNSRYSTEYGSPIRLQ